MLDGRYTCDRRQQMVDCDSLWQPTILSEPAELIYDMRDGDNSKNI